MARPRTAIRKIREVLRLSWDVGLSPRQVETSLGVSRITVRRYLERAERAGLSWPLPDGLDDAGLDAALFPPTPPPPVGGRPMPDFAWVHRELRRKGVTLQLLWMEYKQAHPDGYQHSQFCHLYQRWAGRVDLVLRQTHRAGDKLFVDYAGHTIPIYPPDAPVWQAQLFVAVCGASNYTYAEAGACPTAAGVDRRPRALLGVPRRGTGTARAGLCCAAHNPASVPDQVMWPWGVPSSGVQQRGCAPCSDGHITLACRDMVLPPAVKARGRCHVGAVLRQAGHR
jgi:hypothetical protein